jgi:DNA repair protein RecN (Recombination protein N)
MLALKTLLARKTAMPTLIFDEIDTGISGEVAMKVGLKIKEMARFHQVFAITHSAQMASRADCHWLVYKSHEGDETTSQIRLLSETESLEQIAKMISGSKVGEAALQAARELISGQR